MDTAAKVELYYWIDKKSGKTSAPTSWDELQALRSQGVIDSTCPLTQEGASGWCTLQQLMDADGVFHVEDVLARTKPRGGLRGILATIFGKGG
ncbi:MAG: hypothetical protein R3Y56_04405 [Akkermansia sp.]